MGHSILITGSFSPDKKICQEAINELTEIRNNAKKEKETNPYVYDVNLWKITEDEIIPLNEFYHRNTDGRDSLKNIIAILNKYDIKLNGIAFYEDYDCYTIGLISVIDSLYEFNDFQQIDNNKWKSIIRIKYDLKNIKDEDYDD